MRLPSAGAANWPGGFGNGRPLVSHDLVTGLHTRILRPLRQAPARLGLATEFFSLRHERTMRIAGFWFTGWCPPPLTAPARAEEDPAQVLRF
jgi:hypothetical protein